MIELDYIKQVLESIPQECYGDKLHVEGTDYMVTRRERFLFALWNCRTEEVVLQGNLGCFALFLHAFQDKEKDFVLFCPIGSWVSKDNKKEKEVNDTVLSRREKMSEVEINLAKSILPRLVKQDKFGEEGNCLSACLASIFDLPLTSVPNFIECTETYEWKIELNKWLAPRDLSFLYIKSNCQGVENLFIGQKVIHILVGHTERFTFHAVVGLNGKFIFDPHPDNTRLDDTETHKLGLFIKKFTN